METFYVYQSCPNKLYKYIANSHSQFFGFFFFFPNSNSCKSGLSGQILCGACLWPADLFSLVAQAFNFTSMEYLFGCFSCTNRRSCCHMLCVRHGELPKLVFRQFCVLCVCQKITQQKKEVCLQVNASTAKIFFLYSV